jgi:hypothetical protein
MAWDDRASLTLDSPGTATRGVDARKLLDQVDYLSQGVPVGTVYKSAGTSINSGSGGTTYQNDPHLSFEAEPNEVIRITLEAVYDAGTVGDMKQRFLVPAGALFESTIFSYSTVAPAPLASSSTAEVVGLPGAGAGVLIHFRLSATLFMSTTGGTVNWQWAQNAADATNTTVAKGGCLEYKRMA